MAMEVPHRLCPGDPLNGYKCIRGVLFEESIATGARKQVGPCPLCSGEKKAEPQKVVQMPGTPDRRAEVPEGTRQIHNNVMGHQREPINAKHEQHIQNLRDKALDFYVALHDAGGTDPNQDRFANRNLAIAATEVETALLHAVKGVCARK